MGEYGVLLHRSGRIEDARSAYLEALACPSAEITPRGAFFPPKVTILHNYGSLLATEGDYHGARGAFRDALSSFGNHTPSLVKLGRVLEQGFDDLDGAEECYEKALACCRFLIHKP